MTVREREIRRRKKTEDRKAELSAGLGMLCAGLFIYGMIFLKLFILSNLRLRQSKKGGCLNETLGNRNPELS